MKGKGILKSIPTSKLQRGVKLFKLTASVGTTAMAGKLSEFLSNKENKSEKSLLSKIKQAKQITETLSQMKGAAMKLGQILSIHGEHLFSKEVAQIFAKLQDQALEMEYEQMKKIMVQEFGENFEEKFKDFSRRPIASASIGQVHKAKFGQTEVAVKIQYPGVDKSIDSDVDSLASIFSVLTKIPSARNFNQVTDEIKEILKHETNYIREAENQEHFRQMFENDPMVVIPRVVKELSTRMVLTSELVEGKSLQEFMALNPPQDIRNKVGHKFIEIFYTELFNEGKVQTDPNFANYKIQWEPGSNDPKLVLMDFGAVKEYDEQFRTTYKKLSLAALEDDYVGIRRGAIDLEFLREEDPRELIDLHYEFVKLFLEPFQSENQPYQWGSSDLHIRIRKMTPKFVFGFKFRPPPRDIIFLDRKIAGLYFFLSSLKCEFDFRPTLMSFLK